MTPFRQTALTSLLIAVLTLAINLLPATAQTDQVLIGASGMSGIDLETWATGSIEPIDEVQRLRLSRLHFDACTGIVLHNTGGSALLYAESTGVRYVFQGGESYPDVPLRQGESVMAGPVDYLTIINPVSDPAISVDLLVLSVVTGNSFVEVPMLDENFPFPEDSGCAGMNPDGAVTPTILAEGIAAEGGETLYLGSAVFLPGSTTDGWDLINEGSSFNMLILAGGMSVAGPNSGRAAWIGPGGVNSTYYNEGPIPSFPFINDSPTTVLGLVFGTVTGPGAVWQPT